MKNKKKKENGQNVSRIVYYENNVKIFDALCTDHRDGISKLWFKLEGVEIETRNMNWLRRVF